MLRECCFVWNHALALQRRYYKLFGKYIPVGKTNGFLMQRKDPIIEEGNCLNFNKRIVK